jgi:multicomponent Na+:H+ antiporter subunit B
MMTTEHLIVRVVAKLLIPLILLFGLYVQFHGESGPGGGFQAGVIFAAAFILYALVFGPENTRRVAPEWLVSTLMAVGVLLYFGTGAASLLYGANFLEYGVLGTDFVAGQKLGIFLVELGVGITVSSVMIAIYLAFAERQGSG